MVHPAPARIPAVSVIIPLEFHRGQAGDCLHLWLTGQTWPREDFEVIMACPPDFPMEERRGIQAKMAAGDRLEEFPLHHDIALVEQGARLARGGCFFFTESHVLPEPDTLAKVMQGFQDHPDWAGFSLKSVPIVHNFLSHVEAEFYELGIKPGPDKPAWCQVLDQCFAVRREAYFDAGGFPAEYGHYGEWVLAARLYAMGHQIGYLPEGRIHHYYIGELPELEEFTADFAAGQWRWFNQPGREPAHGLMQEPRTFGGRFGSQRSLARARIKIAWQSALPSRPFLRLAARSWTAGGGALWAERWKYGLAQIRLRWHCHRKDPAALEDLIDLSAAVVEMTQLKEQGRMTLPEAPCLPEQGEWTPSDPTLPILGMYEKEKSGGQDFRWSQPAALIQLNLAPGRYQLELEWLPLLPGLVEPRLFLNETPVPREKQRHFKFRVRCTWHQKNNRPLRLGWSCPSYASPGDPRLLALPVSRISWQRLPVNPNYSLADAEAP